MPSPLQGAVAGFARGAGAGMADLQGHFQQRSLWDRRNKLLRDLEGIRNGYATKRASIRMEHEKGLQQGRFSHDNAATTEISLPDGTMGLKDRTGKITGRLADPESGENLQYALPMGDRMKAELKYLMERDKGLLGVLSSDMASPNAKTAAQTERESVQGQINAILHPTPANASGTGEPTVTDPDNPGAGGAIMPERDGAAAGIIGETLGHARDWAQSGWDAVKPYVPFTGHFTDGTPQTPQDVMTQGRDIVNGIMRRPLRPPQTPGGIIGGETPAGPGPGPSQPGTDAPPPADTPGQRGLDEYAKRIEGLMGGGTVQPPGPPPGPAPVPPPPAAPPPQAAPAPGYTKPEFNEETYDPATGTWSSAAATPLPTGEVTYGQLEQVPNAGDTGAPAPAPPTQDSGIMGQPAVDPYARPRDLTTERGALSPAAPMQRVEPQALGIMGATPTGEGQGLSFGDPKQYWSDIKAALGQAFGTSEQGEPQPETQEDAWTDIAIQSIMKHEQFRDSPYSDRGGTEATGYGMNLDTGERTFADGTRRPTNPTEPEAQRAMVEDVTLAAERVVRSVGRDVWDRLSSVRKAVLVEMAYQHGGSGLRGFDETLAAVAGGDWRMAADEMMDSDTGRETSPDRMTTLAKRMLTGRL